MQVTLPDEVNEVTCTACGAATAVNGNHTAEIDADTGKTSVWLLCSADCGWLGCLFSWEVAPAEYEAIYGHPLPALAGSEPTPPENRELPPGPWGVFSVEPSPIPDEAWSVTCDNKVGWPVRKTCGAYLDPSPTEIDGAGGVFYYDEFTSTATVGYGRCPCCQQLTLMHCSWPLTPEQHYAIFGRTPDEYAPSYDPDDEADFEAEYSLWRTEDRWGLTHFRNLEDLAGTEDWDLRSIGPGEFTIKHWPTGAVWDVPDFVAQHEQVVAAADEYDEDDGDLR
jgi:hypothetical protein